MLAQDRGGGLDGEKQVSVLQSLQAFLMMRAEITYTMTGNWTKRGGKNVSISSLLLLFCCFSTSGWGKIVEKPHPEQQMGLSTGALCQAASGQPGVLLVMIQVNVSVVDVAVQMLSLSVSTPSAPNCGFLAVMWGRVPLGFYPACES